MSNYPNDYHIKAATGRKNNFDLSKTVITTQDFGYIMPLECKFMVPGDHFRVNIKSFTRLMPLPCPTFGRIDHIVRAFFVPFRYIVPNWNEYISNQKVATKSSTLASPAVPNVRFVDLWRAFIGKCCDVAEEGEVYDFISLNTGGDTQNWKIQSGYKPIYNLLHNMGLAIPEVFDEHNTTLNISVLPLLAFWKFYLDWIVPSRWLHQYSAILGILKNPVPLGESEIHKLLEIPSAWLEDDFFTSAFQNPDGYETLVDKDYILSNPSQSIGDVYEADVRSKSSTILKSNVGAEVKTGASTTVGINAFTLRSLGALQDLINRGKLAGTKVQDYLIAEFGLRPSDDALQLSKYLGSFRDTIQIGDVTATADTEASGGAFLGEYAGKAMGQNSGHFEYETKDHGLLIFTSELQVKSSYVQGIRPEWLLCEPFDFFQPEFDNLGTEPIKNSQLDVNSIGSDSIFGFTPTYSKYKTNFDTVGGDFSLKSQGGGIEGHLSSWYLARLFPINSLARYISKDFCRADGFGNGNNYDRIFQVEDGDHFYSIYAMDIKASRPMESISNALETEEGNGKDISIDFQNTMH